MPVADLAALGPPVVHDIGSGLLRPWPLLPDEPDATTSLRDGAAVVTCSGDKLLGGPQAGIVLGRRDVVERMRRHPLARALRAGKTTLAALEATLRGPRAPGGRRPRGRPRRPAAPLRGRWPRRWRGTASAPTSCPRRVASVVARRPGCRSTAGRVALPEAWAEPLRLGDPAVLARVQGGRTLLDLRALDPRQDAGTGGAARAAGGAGLAARRRGAR